MAEQAREQPASSTAPPARKRWARWALYLLLALSPGIAHWAWRVASSWPPSIDLALVSPPVAKAVTAARGAVFGALRDGAAWAELGMTLQAHGFTAEAMACFERAVELDPGNPGWLYLQTLSEGPPDAERVVPLLLRAAALSGDDPTAALRLIDVLVDSRRLDEAAGEIARLASRLPEDPRLLFARARLHFARGDFATARIDVEKSIAGEPRCRQSHLLLGMVLFRLGDADGARAVEARARNVAEEFAWPDPWFAAVVMRRTGIASVLRRAQSLERMGDRHEEERVLRDGVRDFPESGEVWAALGRVLALAERGAEAEEVLARAVALSPALAIAHYYLGVARLLQGRSGPAAESLRRTIAIHPGHPAARFDLAQALVRLGDRSGAIEALETAVRVKPDHVRSRKNLAALLVDAGRDADALPHLEEAVNLAPSDAELLAMRDVVKAKVHADN